MSADRSATKADNPGTSCKGATRFTGDIRVVMADGSRNPRSQGRSRGAQVRTNQKIREVADNVDDGKVIAGGQLDEYKPEGAINTPGGAKGSRRPDILVQRDDGSMYGINVGLQSKRTGAPIKREAEAINDLEQYGNLEMHFVPYN